MKVKTIVHTNVNEDGTFSDHKAGAVQVDGGFLISRQYYGLYVFAPRDPQTATVTVIQVLFENQEEFDEKFKTYTDIPTTIVHEGPVRKVCKNGM